MTRPARAWSRVAAEWRLVQRDRGFRIAVAVLVGGLLVASVSGAMWRRNQEAVVAEAVSSRWAVLPPIPLAMLSVGRSEVQATALPLSARDPGSIMPPAPLGNPLARAIGRFDVAFVIVVLLPLIAMAVTYDVLAEDRETGRLPLLVATGTGMPGLLALRLALRAGPLASCAMVVPVAALTFSGGVPLQDLPRVALWMLTVAAYVAFWAAVSGLANARRMRPATSLSGHIGIWALVVIVVPALLTVVAGAVHPTPSRAALAVAMWGTVVREEVSGFFGALRSDADRTRALVAQFDDAVTRQQDLATRWRFLSPAATTREAFDALAGTGPARYRAFAAEVARHRGARGTDAPSRFAFREPPMSPIVGSVGASLGALLGAGGVVGLAALCVLRRED